MGKRKSDQSKLGQKDRVDVGVGYGLGEQRGPESKMFRRAKGLEEQRVQESKRVRRAKGLGDQRGQETKGQENYGE